MDHAAGAIRGRIHRRGFHGLARVPLPTSIPRDCPGAARGGAGVDRVPERGVLPFRAAARAFLGRVGGALRPHPDHRPQRFCRDGRFCRALVCARSLASSLWPPSGRVPARQHWRDAHSPSRRHPAGSGRVCDLAVRSQPISRLRAGSDDWGLARRPQHPEHAHVVRPRRGNVASRRVCSSWLSRGKVPARRPHLDPPSASRSALCAWLSPDASH